MSRVACLVARRLPLVLLTLLLPAANAVPLALNFSVPVAPPKPIPHFNVSTRPDGVPLGLDSAGFTLNGARVFNVAGEMHFSRVPASSWLGDLQLMRAAGLTTVSTYVLWIHHEEVQGTYTWSGQRNLTAFVLAAQAAGLNVALRVGPYGHAEARGGGLPDWIQAIPGISVRSNTTLFMSYATAWYAELCRVLPDALWWQHGGPIITIQLDNESSSASYLVALRAAAIAVGLVPPFFTVTGLESSIPFGYAQPLAGRYAVRFWDKPDVPFSPSGDYLFRGPDYAGSGYATLYCELGAGMVSAYHRRVNVDPMDMYADALVTMAAAQDLGYYMWVLVTGARAVEAGGVGGRSFTCKRVTRTHTDYRPPIRRGCTTRESHLLPMQTQPNPTPTPPTPPPIPGSTAAPTPTDS